MNEIRKKNRFVAAYNGLVAVYNSERNFKIHLFTFIAVVISGFYFGISKVEWMMVLGCAFLVLTCEIFNTAIEKLCDFVHPKFDSNIGRIKDMAAAAVLTCTIMSIVIGVLVFMPYLINRIGDLA